MWLTHVACCCAAAETPHKHPTVQRRRGHLLTRRAPISISGLAGRPVCSQYGPKQVNCAQIVRGSSPEAIEEGNQSAVASRWRPLSAKQTQKSLHCFKKPAPLSFAFLHKWGLTALEHEEACRGSFITLYRSLEALELRSYVRHLWATEDKLSWPE